MPKPVDAVTKELDNIKKRKDKPLNTKLSSTNSLLALIVELLLDIREKK